MIDVDEMRKKFPSIREQISQRLRRRNRGNNNDDDGDDVNDNDEEAYYNMVNLLNAAESGGVNNLNEEDYLSLRQMLQENTMFVFILNLYFF